VNGGAAAVALSEARALARRGYDVIFVCAVGPVLPELESSGVRVFCLGQRDILGDPSRVRASLQGIWNMSASSALASILGKLDVPGTIVHLHGWTKALTSSVVRAAVSKGIAIVCTLHDYFIACPNGGFFNYQSQRCCELEAMSLACVACNCDFRGYSHKLWRVARQFVQERVGRAPSGISAFVVHSNLSRDILRGHLPKQSLLFTVTNPIDVPKTGAVEVARNRTYTFVGRLGFEKGAVLFAEAARDCSIPATFVGEGESRPHIATAYPSAIITGWLSQDRVQELLVETRAVVFPSLLYETQGLVVLEAAARGVPAIVSDGCAARESIEDGVTGLLFRNGDRASLAAALMRLQDNALVARLGRAAYERFWSDPPTLDKHVDQLIRVYSELLAD
jgi:glycosyltransferase involved in cell wall biosynthesis